MCQNPIRVLQVVTNMSYGGLENLLMNYFRHIDRNRVQFDFLTHVDIHQDFEEEITTLGGNLYRLPMLNPLSIHYRSELQSFLASHPEYKIVHSHLDCTAGFPLKFAKATNVPIRIAHAHNSNQSHNLKYLLKIFYRHFIPKHATHLFACGKEAGNWMFRGLPYTIVRNAIDVSNFTFSSQKSASVKADLCISDKFVIGHVGQFRQQKNHSFLIKIFNEVHHSNPNAVLLLVGKGPEMQATQDLVHKLGLSNSVYFLGARSDIPDLMQAMDLFILPSLFEGLPVTMIEAQAAGLPCIISDKVPLECKITEDVTQISLEAPLSEWADSILRYQSFSKKDTTEILQQSGYDIVTNAKWLEEFYCNGAKS